VDQEQWRAVWGGANGAPVPGIQEKGSSKEGITKLKCCNKMIFPIVRLLTHDACILFFETCFFVNTSFYIFQCQSFSHSSIPGTYTPILKVCGAHPIKLIVAWLFPDRAIKGKSEKGKRIQRQEWRSNWFSEPNFNTVVFQLAWFSWLFDTLLVSRFVFSCGNPRCALIHLRLQYVHHFELLHWLAVQADWS